MPRLKLKRLALASLLIIAVIVSTAASLQASAGKKVLVMKQIWVWKRSFKGTTPIPTVTCMNNNTTFIAISEPNLRRIEVYAINMNGSVLWNAKLKAQTNYTVPFAISCKGNILSLYVIARGRSLEEQTVAKYELFLKNGVLINEIVKPIRDYVVRGGYYDPINNTVFIVGSFYNSSAKKLFTIVDIRNVSNLNSIKRFRVNLGGLEIPYGISSSNNYVCINGISRVCCIKGGNALWTQNFTTAYLRGVTIFNSYVIVIGKEGTGSSSQGFYAILSKDNGSLIYIAKLPWIPSDLIVLTKGPLGFVSLGGFINVSKRMEGAVLILNGTSLIHVIRLVYDNITLVTSLYSKDNYLLVSGVSGTSYRNISNAYAVLYEAEVQGASNPQENIIRRYQILLYTFMALTFIAAAFLAIFILRILRSKR